VFGTILNGEVINGNHRKSQNMKRKRSTAAEQKQAAEKKTNSVPAAD